MSDTLITGKQRREFRQKHKITLSEVAKLMGVSAPYLYDLEMDKRGWNDQRIARWNEIMQEKVKQP